MKVYLDDERKTPEGWVRTYSSEETITLLRTGRVQVLSMDHDLGFPDDRDNGNKVVLWLEEQVILHNFIPPAEMVVHSSNSSAVQKMLLGIEQIKKKAEENERRIANLPWPPGC
jgi:hypothetical protein